jgi:hypothetical protein
MVERTRKARSSGERGNIMSVHDTLTPPHPKRKREKPGAIAANKLGVYDHGPDGELRLRGQVGPTMTSSGVSRFHGKLGSTIQTVRGRKAWVAPDRNVTGGFGSAQNAKRMAQLRQARGSVKS